MKKVTLIGGDNRLRAVKNGLTQKGYTVDSIGLFEADNGDISSSDAIVLPVPTTKDKVNVFAPLTNREIKLSDIEKTVTDKQLILSCNYNFKNKRCVDYGALNSYALLNAVPTAEGAIKIAMENTLYTIWKSSALVIGYGRVGKILADRLKALGANVTVSARKPADFAMLDALGLKYINTEHLYKEALNYNMIFNTVDFEVLPDEILKKCRTDLIIDLSSLGGFDLKKADEYGITAIKAPGLPNIVAPQTAAEILNDTILNLLI